MLKNFHLSMRTSLWLSIALMGALGMALALATGAMYREEALDSQRVSLVALVELKASDLLGGLEVKALEFAAGVQREPEFRKVFLAKDQAGTRSALDGEIRRYFENAGSIKLEKLYAFDVKYKLLAESSGGVSTSTPGGIVCDQLVSRASRRDMGDRLKPLSQLCLANGRPYHAVLIPIGGPLPEGYLQVISDPTVSLRSIESALGMPVKLNYIDGVQAYRSPNWPRPNAMEKVLVADYRLNTYAAQRALTVSVAYDIRALQEKLARTRNIMLLVAGLSTLLAVVIALLVLQRTAINPLRSLIAHIKLVLEDRSHLGEQVSVAGNVEISELAASFNTLTGELNGLYASLENMAFNDSLTGLPNRTLFNDRVNQVALTSQRQKMSFAVFMMDLNRFKQVNDTLGHGVGDMLLQQVAVRLQRTLRKSDTVSRAQDDTLARLGGDEFAAILPMLGSPDYALAAAHRIMAEMEQPFEVDGHSLSVGISIGIAVYPKDGDDVSTLMRHADVAMYYAKQGQRGISFYDQMQDQHSLSQLTLEPELQQALEADALALHFQPKIDMKSGTVCGAEALLRWQHPERGFIPPDTFIPMAEQTGLIHPLTQWVLNRALEQCACWHREGFPISVAVNLSACSLRDMNIVDDVVQALERWGVAAEFLCLELTEGAIMADQGRAMEILTRLDEMGVSLSVDDFGTGYSSLAYLKKLPVDEIKIDKSFVIDMNQDSNDAVIVRSTIDLAHNMSLRVVAEGVEDDEIMRHLTSLHCDVVQGYYVSRPIPAAEFMECLCNLDWQRAGTE